MPCVSRCPFGSAVHWLACHALTLNQAAPDDLARRCARNGVDDLVAAHPLVRRDAFGHVSDGLVCSALWIRGVLHDQEGLGHLAGFVVRACDDGGVGDQRMRDEDRLELGGSYVEAL